MRIMIDLNDFFGGQVGNFINALRMGWGSLAHGEDCARAILSARSGINNAPCRVKMLARLHQNRRSRDIHIDIGKWVRQAQNMIDLPREVKDVVLSLYEII